MSSTTKPHEWILHHHDAHIDRYGNPRAVYRDRRLRHKQNPSNRPQSIYENRIDHDAVLRRADTDLYPDGEAGLYDNFLVFIIPGLYTFFNMVIFMSFFRTIPDSLEESAKVDGASDYGVLFRIVLPNSMAVIATIALFSAVYHWNDYYQGVIYIRSQELLPLQTMLYKIIAENSMSFMQQQAMAQFGARLPGNSIKFASMMVATLPILSFYPFIQRYLIKGVMIGAIKG